jgi:uncharacterized protein
MPANSPEQPAPATARKKRPGFIARLLWRVGYFVAGFYGVVIAMLMWIENSMVYPAPRTEIGDWNTLTAWRGEDAEFTSADGTKLHGWYFPHRDPKRVIVLYHGNGENVAMCAQEGVWLHDNLDASVLVFDYRGYGKSEGEPSEKGICEDGDAAAQWLAKRAGVKTSDLTLAAHSLGTGVAVDVGVKHQVKTLLLMSPFAEMPDAAAAQFWFVPVRLLMKNRYASVKKIPAFKGATFIAHGDYDNVVPQWSGKRLYEAAPEPKQFVPLANTGHNDMPFSKCEKELIEFVRRVDAK